MLGRLDLYALIFIVSCMISCSSNETPTPPVEEPEEQEETMDDDALLPNIDLSNWKVTLPIGNPTEIEPPAIVNYATNPVLQKYMYNDSIDGSLVFYTSPGSTTTNSKYSRTELREQLVAGSNKVNWTFAQGGQMRGRLKVQSVSGEEGNRDRIIVMQIHGRLTDEQRDLIGEDDNNAPPVLKIYWDDGKINVRRKVLKDLDVNDTDILRTNAWTDESNWFDKNVGFEEFELEVIVDASSMTINLGSEESLVFDDVHIDKWAIFENYFKAGNYLQSAEAGTFSRVKYYELEVIH